MHTGEEEVRETGIGKHCGDEGEKRHFNCEFRITSECHSVSSWTLVVSLSVCWKRRPRVKQAKKD